MLLESVSSAAKRVEELLNSINENNVNLETPFHIEDHFTGLYLLAKYWPIKFEDSILLPVV
jgi:paired amphipathic helix protein Sin3a